MSKIKKRSSIHIFLAVIRALFLRELDMRLTQGKSGLVWTFLSPFLQIMIFVSLHVLIKEYKGNVVTSFSYTAFMASGFIGFNLFRSILTQSMGAFTANRALFSYKQVKPIDTVIARIVVEIFLMSCIIIIFLMIGFFSQIDNFLPENTLMVCLGFIWIIVFSFGIGLLVGIGNFFYMSIGKVISVISFMLLILSAVFFPLVSIPQQAQDILLYNPLVHFMEMIHGFYVQGLSDEYVDYTYMLYWTVIPIVLSLWLYIKLEKRIISQ